MIQHNTSEKIFCDKVFKRALRKLPDYNVDKMTITIDSKIHEDLNLNSLDIVQTVMELEHKYDISIDFNRASDFQTVNDVYKSVIDALTIKNKEVKTSRFNYQRG